jgi:hypothetical protein
MDHQRLGEILQQLCDWRATARGQDGHCRELVVLPRAMGGGDMPHHAFNADAILRLVEYESRALRLRQGTDHQIAGAREITSRVLIAGLVLSSLWAPFGWAGYDPCVATRLHPPCRGTRSSDDVQPSRRVLSPNSGPLWRGHEQTSCFYRAAC